MTSASMRLMWFENLSLTQLGKRERVAERVTHTLPRNPSFSQASHNMCAQPVTFGNGRKWTHLSALPICLFFAHFAQV